MSVRFPAYRGRGLGVGLDLPWDDRTGFGPSPTHDRLAPGARAFLVRHAASWSHVFFSWQPRDRTPPTLGDYQPAWDDAFSLIPPGVTRALHHTALNLASLGPYRRGELLEFTAALCERYALRWVNEDVGFWSLDGRAVPYPLPPVLDREGLRATVANVRECQRALPVPLALEFPGFSAGASVVVGAMHAYDFFNELAEETEAPVTLDVGHLLSWQWWRGRRGEALFDELERLPLRHCFELHLSGCEVVGDSFIDAHHGRLLDAQLELTRRLLSCCPNLRAITYEDPRFDPTGTLLAGNQGSWQGLETLVADWVGPAPEPVPPKTPARACTEAHDPIRGAEVEAALGAYLHGAVGSLSLGLPVHEEASAVTAVRSMVRDRCHRGTGTVREWYPDTLAAWLEAHPEDVSLTVLVARFCASPAAGRWREHSLARRGCSLEEAWYDFFEAEGIGDPGVREDELLAAVVQALAVAPRSSFEWPARVRATPKGCAAVGRTLTLHAVSDGHYLRGTVTPLVAELLAGRDDASVGSTRASHSEELALVRARLVELGLLADPPADAGSTRGGGLATPA